MTQGRRTLVERLFAAIAPAFPGEGQSQRIQAGMIGQHASPSAKQWDYCQYNGLRPAQWGISTSGTTGAIHYRWHHPACYAKASVVTPTGIEPVFQP